MQYTFTFQLSKVYSNSLLGDSFDRIEVEEFIKGSVIVNYYVHFKDLDEPVSTNDLKFILNQELEVDGAGPNDDGVSALGRFKVDPIYTDFVGMKCYKRKFIYMDNKRLNSLYILFNVYVKHLFLTNSCTRRPWSFCTS